MQVEPARRFCAAREPGCGVETWLQHEAVAFSGADGVCTFVLPREENWPDQTPFAQEFGGIIRTKDMSGSFTNNRSSWQTSSSKPDQLWHLPYQHMYSGRNGSARRRMTALN